MQNNTYPMKWYKFLLVVLWLGMIGNAISAFSFFTGLPYLDCVDEVYEALPLLKLVDKVSGLYCVGLVLVGFVVWLGLKNYRWYAPTLLLLMYAANIIFLIADAVALHLIIGGSETTVIYGSSHIAGNYQYQTYVDLNELSFSASDLISIIISIVMAIANYIYFRNRASLFVN